MQAHRMKKKEEDETAYMRKHAYEWQAQRMKKKEEGEVAYMQKLAD